ncbi:MAG: hypothetical protein AAF846_11380 [Chloroflexota bacterium]
MILRQVGHIVDELEHFWEEVFMKRVAGLWLVFIYLAMIIVVEVNRQGLFPFLFPEQFPDSHFFAVEVAFTLLLLTEVVSLIFALTTSFSKSIGIQFELLSLILIREVFKQFTYFAEPLEWEPISSIMPNMMVDAVAALGIFLILQVYYRIQKQYSFIREDTDQENFINSKKLIALSLLLIFVGVGLLDMWRFVTGGETYPFFETFFTILIFADVMMVLLSMHYGNSYAVTFRNFAYALVTVFIRISLVAPPPINGAIGIGAMLFALAVSFIYNTYGANLDLEPNTHEDVKRRTKSMPKLEPGMGD